MFFAAVTHMPVLDMFSKCSILVANNIVPFTVHQCCYFVLYAYFTELGCALMAVRKTRAREEPRREGHFKDYPVAVFLR